MRRMQRIALIITLIAITPVFAGCADFDPEKLDIFGLGDKKKLPGDRQPVFPAGVPGVTQGIPPEFLKENQPPPETAQAVPDSAAPAAEPPKQAVAVAPAAKPAPKPKPKRTAKPKPKSKPKPVAQQPPPAAWPVPAQQQPQQQKTAPSSTAPWPATGDSSDTAPWPTAPAPGTFSR